MKHTTHDILTGRNAKAILTSHDAMPGEKKVVVKDCNLLEKTPKVAVPVDIYLNTKNTALTNLSAIARNAKAETAMGAASKKVLHNFRLLLMAYGLEERICNKLLDTAGGNLVKDGNINLDAFSDALGQFVNFGFNEFPEKIAFFGSSGVGKTTAMAKFAYFAKEKLGKNTALVTLDSYKISGARHLGRIGEVLDLPVYLARSSKDLILTLNDLKQMDLVLIDTAGCNVQEMDKVHQVSSWMDNYDATQSEKSASIKKVLLLPAGSNVFDLRKMVQEFSELKLSGLGITKADETCYFGPCLNTVLQNTLSLNFVTSGQSMDEGIEVGRDALSKKVVNLLFRGGF